MHKRVKQTLYANSIFFCMGSSNLQGCGTTVSINFFINEDLCKNQANHLLVTILFMDDLIILANNVTQLKWLKFELEKHFEMCSLEKLHR